MCIYYTRRRRYRLSHPFMSPKFLCCLPVRLGVFLISFFQFLVSGGLAAFLWWALWSDSENDGEQFPFILLQIFTLFFSRYCCKEHENYHHRCGFSIHCCRTRFSYRVCVFFLACSLSSILTLNLQASSALSYEDINLSRPTLLCFPFPFHSKSRLEFGTW